MKPRILDLFCGAGGAARGYADAGFEVVGVDNRPQPNYPFEFHLFDALEFDSGCFHAIHASPPCQGYSPQTADQSRHSRLIERTRHRLEGFGVPYVVEIVEGARRHLRNPIRLCGSSFGLDLRRHRYFEANWPLVGKPCEHSWQTPRFQSLDRSMVVAGRLASVVGVHGHINYPGEFEYRKRAMGIDWMKNDELVESIPPAYTRFIGEQLIQYLRNL